MRPFLPFYDTVNLPVYRQSSGLVSSIQYCSVVLYIMHCHGQLLYILPWCHIVMYVQFIYVVLCAVLLYCYVLHCYPEETIICSILNVTQRNDRKAHSNSQQGLCRCYVDLRTLPLSYVLPLCIMLGKHYCTDYYITKLLVVTQSFLNHACEYSWVITGRKKPLLVCGMSKSFTSSGWETFIDVFVFLPNLLK